MTFDIPGHLHQVLGTPVTWGPVTAQFQPEPPPSTLTSNVHVVPFTGSKCILCRTAQSGWEMPGGTIEIGETITDALTRELREEIGATVHRHEIFAAWDCRSAAPSPYRPHIPHPHFAIAIGWAEVTLTDTPGANGGAEDILEVVEVPLPEAITRFVAAGRPEFAALYELGALRR